MHNSLEQQLRLFALQQLSGFGPVRFQQVLEQCDLADKNFWPDLLSLLSRVPRLGDIKKLQQQVEQPLTCPWPERDRLLLWLEQPQRHLIAYGSAHYPDWLTQIGDPPIVLQGAGHVSLLSQPQIAIVGARHATAMGLNDASQFAGALAELGWTITSGLAEGIDAAAHQGALNAQGHTIAVLGTGLDQIYPAKNSRLAQHITEQGLLISEYPLGTAPKAAHFPRRNRIVSGLSVGVLVVEAALKSGSLISARLASEQGREVFAIPGSIHQAQNKGCHQLIKQGAKLTETIMDIHEELQHWLQIDQQLPTYNRSTAKASTPKRQQLSLLSESAVSTAALGEATAQKQKTQQPDPSRFATPEQYQIVQAIFEGAVSVDTVILATNLDAAFVSQQLMLLELQGVIQQKATGYQLQ
ncbi:DNA processing protein [Oceanospirillum multiglobuliferum]|uniref:DNA protecting protein DprA n=1 Tax=Oceanospirillum multiglobuliferum TaxID=64969 RepID=A0A1T4NQG6_9GAMM|nr:DNA-processing protein DprA [Oceanospirillum multiglobuliferum]OPX55713.1 DNA protecting protein DprA [Oceanospirillum multiglobuliferum]SJZ81449.1 DNA processing protein [Oceanospirillum multiglobuliferum]